MGVGFGGWDGRDARGSWDTRKGWGWGKLVTDTQGWFQDVKILRKLSVLYTIRNPRMILGYSDNRCNSGIVESTSTGSLDISEEQLIVTQGRISQVFRALPLPTVLPALRDLQRPRLTWNSGLTANIQSPSLELNAFSLGVWYSLLGIRWKIGNAYIPSSTWDQTSKK